MVLQISSALLSMQMNIPEKITNFRSTRTKEMGTSRMLFLNAKIILVDPRGKNQVNSSICLYILGAYGTVQFLHILRPLKLMVVCITQRLSSRQFRWVFLLEREADVWGINSGVGYMQ